MHSLYTPAFSFAVAIALASGLNAAPKPYEKPAQTRAASEQLTHTVKRGETMWSIAQKHRTSVGELMEYNKLENHNVREGMVLKIPQRVVEDPRKTQSRQHIHIVRSGEDFWQIADKYDITSKELADANPNVNPNRLHEDMELVIPGNTRSLDKTADETDRAPKPSNDRIHVVTNGETYYSISKQENVSLNALMAANPEVKPERLVPGTKLKLPGTSGSSSTNVVKNSTEPAPAKPKTHTVRNGESVMSISNKYNVSPESLLKQNNMKSGDDLYIGDTLTIPTASNNSTSSKKVANSAPTKTYTPSSKQNEVSSDGSIKSYTVSASETADTISEAFGISKQRLLEYNHLSPNTRLKPGDVIKIPSTTSKVVSR